MNNKIYIIISLKVIIYYIPNEEALNKSIFILKFNEGNKGLIYNLKVRYFRKILESIYYQGDNKISYFELIFINNILYFSKTK